MMQEPGLKPWRLPTDVTLAELEKLVRQKSQTELCLVQNGYFFEAYGESAQILAEELGFDIAPNKWGVTTSGFPVNSRERNLARLQDRGVSYALVEQVSEDLSGRMLREVTQIHRPGRDKRQEEIAILRAGVGSNADMTASSTASAHTSSVPNLRVTTLSDGTSAVVTEDGEIIRRIPPRSTANLGWHVREAQKSYQFPRHGERWTEEEDQTLTQRFLRGKRIDQLAEIHERTPNGIRARLIRLELIEE